MTQQYWDNAHKEKFSQSDWDNKPSLFLKFAVKYFPKTGRVLDIGTGQGQDAAYLQSLGYQVVATDFSEAALASAQKKVKGVEFIKADTAQPLPFEAESFDVVNSHLALHYFNQETTARIFKEIHRVLKPGGIFSAICNTINDPEIKSSGYIELEENFYKTPQGLTKRYFSSEYFLKITDGLFEPIVADDQGETYKDKIKTLARFVGRKVN